jgi:hypothetical protein
MKIQISVVLFVAENIHMAPRKEYLLYVRVVR